MSELKSAELNLLTAREKIEELEVEKAALHNRLIDTSDDYCRFLAVNAELSKAKAEEKAVKPKYGESVLKEFFNTGMTDHKEFNSNNKSKLHATVTRNTLIRLNDDDIFAVLRWIYDNSSNDNKFWDDMVTIKTTGMVGKLGNFIPAYAEEDTERLSPLIWEDFEFGVRVESGVWEFENTEEEE